MSFFISCLLYTKGGANWVGYRYQTSAPAGDIRCSRFKSCGEKNPAWESVSWLFQLGFPSYLAENMACPKPPNDNDTNLGEGTVHHFVRWRRWYENFTFEQTWSNLIWLHLRRPKKILPGIELSWLARHIVAARHGCFGDASMEVSSLYDPLMSPHLLEHHTEAWSWRFLWHS